MSKVSMNTRLNASADAVWKVLREFNGLPVFIAAIKESTMEGSGVGAVRTLTLEGGGPPIVEKLEALDDQAKTFSYSIVTSPLPLTNYLAKVETIDLGASQCEVKWQSTFEPHGATEAEAVKVIEGVYSAAFEGLHKLFG
ncbi:MAG: SRPBCC family protein [Syntrophobacteraceae bacterium]|nr:SRPBCC family protein [Syntrophobacteraceae bacterium]